MRIPVQKASVFAFVAFVLGVLGLTTRAANVVTLPVEVVGPDGSSNSATVDVPPAQAAQVRSLWMQIHNLAYADMVSVQLNDRRG